MAEDGNLGPPCCTACGAILPSLQRRDQVIADLEHELRAKRSQITRLKNEALQESMANPEYADARRVFDYWRAKLSPRAREFKDDRLANVLARLRAGATVEELCKAIDGCALRPYVGDHGARTSTGKRDQKFADLALICRSEANVERFTGYAEAEEEGPRVSVPKPKPSPTIPGAALAAIKPPSEEVAARLAELRGWTPEAIRRLGIGIDGDRVVFPIHDAEGTLVGLGYYAPNPERRGSAPKMLQEGRRDLFPAPESIEQAGILWLVEGEADATAMWSLGFPAVGVPGVAAWRPEWAKRFAKFDRIIVCFDCDEPGRKAAAKRADEIPNAEVLDLHDERHDGYDLSDLIRERGKAAATYLTGRSVPRSAEVIPITSALAEPPDPRSPWEKFTEALEAHDCHVRMTGPQRAMANCPVHADRTPSLALGLGDDERVLLTCHAGCERKEIVAALGLDWTDLFPDRRAG